MMRLKLNFQDSMLNSTNWNDMQSKFNIQYFLYLNCNSVLEAVVRDPEPEQSGTTTELNVEILYPGDGENFPVDGNEVIISYTAYLPDGDILETFPYESPLQYSVGSGIVIAGLDYVIKTMSLGEQVRAIIPGEYAYGADGVPGRVPENCTIVYDIYLASIL